MTLLNTQNNSGWIEKCYINYLFSIIISIFIFWMRFLFFFLNCSKAKKIHIFVKHIPKNPRFGLIFLHNLQGHVSLFHFLIFTSISSREASSLYSDCSFAQRDALCVQLSWFYDLLFIWNQSRVLKNF